MGLLSYPTAITNGSKSTHTELNSDFTAVSSLVNGNLDGANFSLNAQITTTTVACTSLLSNWVTSANNVVFTLPNTDGSSAVSFTNALDQEVLRVSSDGRVTFYGGVDKALAPGTILMYNGSAIPNADTRSSECSEVGMYGWYVCNGQASTPDLRNRFLLGATTSGTTGGSDDAQVPQHTHTVNSATGISGVESVKHVHTVTLRTDSTQPNHYHNWYVATTGTSYSNYQSRPTSSAQNGSDYTTSSGDGAHTQYHIWNHRHRQRFTHPYRNGQQLQFRKRCWQEHPSILRTYLFDKDGIMATLTYPFTITDTQWF